MKRYIEIDVLRIIAAFCVVMLHTSAKYLRWWQVGTSTFSSANFIDSISRFGVPLFVMVSGALFLSGDHSVNIKRLWTHNIFRMLIIYLLWSFVYYSFSCIHFWNITPFSNGVMGLITGICYGSSHLWFLPMIAGLYALTPVLKTWLANAERKEIEYFLILFFVFNIVFTSINGITDKSIIIDTIKLIKIAELSGYLGYYVLGFYLFSFDISSKMKKLCYGLLPLCIIFNFLISQIMSVKANAYSEGIYNSFGIFTFLETITVFVMVKAICNKKIGLAPGHSYQLISNISKDTLGIYMLHVALIDYVADFNLFNYCENALIWTIPLSLGFFIICLLVSAILRRIPFIGRYIC